MIVTCEKCGKSFNKHPSSIKKTKHDFCSLKCFGVSISNKIEFNCLNCGKQDSYHPSQDKYYNGNGKYCSEKCKYDYYKEHPEVTPNYIRGSTIDSRGYRVIRGRREHRIVMEKYLGRALLTDEHLHHIDGNKSNNSLINLLLISSSEHGKMHYKERKLINGRFA